MGVEVTDIGEYTSSGAFVVRHGEEIVACLDLGLVHDGTPRLELTASWRPPASQPLVPPADIDLGALLRRVLARPNVCSKEWFVRQYDHEVQAGSVVKPLVGARHDGPSDGAVLRPRLDSARAIAIAHGICPRYGDLDTFHMAQCALDEAVRSAVAVGADPEHLWALDNFCWPDPVVSAANPDGEHKLAQLVRACTGLYEGCVAYRVPLISGKDSMKNDYRAAGVSISVPPTLLVSVLGIVPDAEKAVTMDAKRAGDKVYLVGTTGADLGRSEAAAELGSRGGEVPRCRDLSAAIAVYQALHRAVRRGLVASCHDCSDGGLAVALAETAFAGGLGLAVDLGAVPTIGPLTPFDVLFSETPCRLVVTVAPNDAAAFESLVGTDVAEIGAVTAASRLRVVGPGAPPLLDEPIEALREAWQAPMRW
jgi:phosphoribosylformylglycinamidine synthase